MTILILKVNQVYPPELRSVEQRQCHRSRNPCLSCISFAKGFVSSKIYDKRDYFEFDRLNLPLLDAVLLQRWCLQGLLESAIMLRNSALEINFNGQTYPTGLSVS